MKAVASIEFARPGILAAVLLVSSLQVSAASAQSTEANDTPSPISHAVYIEALGNAGLISFNYELGIQDKFAVRAGVGTIILFISYPLTASYLIGQTSNRLELGAGVTIVKYPTNADGTTIFGSLGDRASFGTAVVGYRYQPQHGILFRVGFTPLVNSGGFFPLGGVSLGYRF
jgi:hypothetical protein